MHVGIFEQETLSNLCRLADMADIFADNNKFYDKLIKSVESDSERKYKPTALSNYVQSKPTGWKGYKPKAYES